jgi:FMN reductase
MTADTDTSLTKRDATSDGLRSRRLVSISAGTSEPSSTRMLADRIADRSLQQMGDLGCVASVRRVELAPLAVAIAQATVTPVLPDDLRETVEQLALADAIIACTPVYKAAISGLFKSFVDLLDDDLIIAKPVLLGATAGTSRHALVLPTSVFAAPEDWATPELGDRISRAATELAVTVAGGVEHAIAERAWSGYQHQFAGSATRAEREAADIDFDSPLMRLAAGGTTGPRSTAGS